MTSQTHKRRAPASSLSGSASKIAIALCLTMGLAACSGDPWEKGEKIKSWTLADHAQRHPILVSKKPASLSLDVRSYAYGLAPSQKSKLISFLSQYRAQDSGNSKIRIKAPSGAGNEVAAMQAVREIKRIAEDFGFNGSTIHVTPYNGGNDHEPPIRLSYLRYVAEGPECGKDWSQNLAQTGTNLPYPDFGCADQRNLAALVANPADLLGPRTMTPRPGEVRDGVWEKFKKGESTISQKQQDERVQVEGAQ